ncbi:MAG TPA: hypothetical protein VHX12_13840 [Acidisoma sp.]|jgi:hypothetical protein|nr:hypothetical protein [Acidisoma sp.]
MSLKEIPTDRLPSLFGEDYVFALLLRMVREHCSTMTASEVDSYGVEAHADAMRSLVEAGFIEIIEQTNGRMRAKMHPKGEELVAQFLAERNAGR